VSAAAPEPTATETGADPYAWLEDVLGERALAWVHARNAESRQVLTAHPRFNAMRDGFRAVLDARDKIPYVTRRGADFYNLWRDAEHPRGLWRRTTLAEYRQAEPAWETVIDLDALATAEGENWVWAGATALGPAYDRCLVALSRGGADATVVREFDTRSKCFVAGGFTLPEAKTSVCWASTQSDAAVYIGTDFGPGSLTDSGYPRLIKRWRRGQPLAAAVTVFEAQPQDVSASVWVDATPGFERTVLARATDFYNSEQFLLVGDRLQKIHIPSDAEIGFWRDRALLQLRSDWAVGARVWPAGALLIGDAAAILAITEATDATAMPPLHALFTPTATRSLAGYSLSASQVLVEVLDNVAGRLEAWQALPAAPGGSGASGASGESGLSGASGRSGERWQRREITTPFPGTLAAQALHDPLLGRGGEQGGAGDPLAEHFMLTYADFLTPDALLLGETGQDALQPLKSLPACFDVSGMRVEQRHASSADGTRIPYFVVWPKGALADGSNPTLLYGYGGFEVAKQPWYSAGFGTAWFAHGGVLVVANIRGGGEFGPTWHQAAIRAKKQNSYDDFAAVAADLISSRVTSATQLGIQGGSNGGLLVGAVMLQRPELFGAVLCQVPLLDMRRYHQLLAGASWMAEYGNPDLAEDWAWIKRYSPYQNVQAGITLPPVLFTTSTRDDRVHPGHARKMAARMIEQGHAPLYWENTEGGHAGAADNAQKADMMALEFAFLWLQLGRR
jgi:prolyl oligopeptidase